MFNFVEKQVQYKSPAPGTGTICKSYYTRPAGNELVSYQNFFVRNDSFEDSQVRFSDDNGKSWTEAGRVALTEKHPTGTLLRHMQGGYCDPLTGHYLTFRVEGILPTGHPLEGQRFYQIKYTVSTDGGKSNLVDEQVIHEGADFSSAHPLPGVWLGKNCYMLGDTTCRPLTRPDGAIIMPISISQLGPDGTLLRKNSTFTYAAIMIGRWRPDNKLAWTLSEPVYGDPQRTSRGLIEPTVEFLDDGRLLMVMRGSNDADTSLPGFRWQALSSDGGQTWSEPTPWTYADGKPFFSPSACSQLLKHSNGRLYWIGNISPNNTRGNSPRYPLVIVEVDRESGLLLQETVLPIADRQPEESEQLMISNFYAREDRETKEVLVFCSPLFAHQKAGAPMDWTTDSLIYRVRNQ